MTTGRPGYRFGIATILGGASYPALREVWQAIDETDIDLITFWDHYMPPFGDPDAINHEIWTLLGAIGEVTRRVRFASAVLSTARHDARLIANAAATVDHIANGRFELGLGAGGPPDEANRYGQPLPPPGERVARLDESIRVITTLWTEKRATFAGRFFTLADAPCEPKPIQQPIPITVAGGGKRSLRIAARHAAGWRAFGTTSAETLGAKVQELAAACAAVGRDIATLERADAITPPPDLWTSDPAAGVAAVKAYADHGLTCFLFPARPPFNIPLIRQFARDVLPAMRAALE